MNTRRIALTLAAVLMVTAVAMASPIFGAWRGELNGRVLTVKVDYVNKQPVVTMTSDAQPIATSNAVFPKGGPPMQLNFQASGVAKLKVASSSGDSLSFELRTEDGQTATLRLMDGGKVVQTVHLTKQK